MRASRLPVCAGALAVLLLTGTAARAGNFDVQGEYQAAKDAIFYTGFDEDPGRYLPEDTDPSCQDVMFTRVDAEDALDGKGMLSIDTAPNCAERIVVDLPAKDGSYRASVWMRHGALDVALIVLYQDGSGLDGISVALGPTGRTTSDGWVELASNAFPVVGGEIANSYLKVVSHSHQNGVDLDALEIVQEGEFIAQKDCKGLGDATCTDEEICVYGRCALGRIAFPPLPADAIRNDVVDAMESRFRVLYGGQVSRALHLPKAIAEMEQMRVAKTPWQFWQRWTTAIHCLHDWHTNARVDVGAFIGSKHQLNVCFIEGDADESHAVWPKDPKFADLLVSHSGDGNAGLVAGDRLVAVDGQHPLAWASSLQKVNLGYHVATDPAIYSDFAEGMSGLILRFAAEITVIRCHAESGTCDALPETIQIADLANDATGPNVNCDNRPFYHLDGMNAPNPATHRVFGKFFRGPITGTSPEEAIFGMVFDNLYGGGDPNGNVNKNISDAITDWKANARGVILDHRAGNGGTLDAPTNLTRLVRPEQPIAIIRMPIQIGGFDGPNTQAEGLALFEKFKTVDPYMVGAADYAVDLPVALIVHRDGSASDYLPYGMKGAPKVRIFGPHPTSGAFSTYIEMFAMGGLSFQFASGDTIGYDGTPLIGRGVVPDETILPKQSDLLAGKDTLHEAALAWVRSELKP